LNVGSGKTLAVGGSLTNSAGTANGVAYLNGSKVLTTGSTLTWNGSAFAVNGTISTTGDATVGSAGGTRTLTIGNTSSTGAGFINIVTSSAFKNWQIASNQYVASTLSFTPSTATGGTTFTTPSLNILDIGLSTGNIGVGGTTPTSSGAGITFPATQSASTDANTLDDYEEGTWTPTQGAGLTVVGTFSSSGTYTKIGRQVTIFGTVSGSTTVAVTASNTVFCAGLPAAISSTNNAYPGLAINNQTTASMPLQVTTTTIYAAGTMAATQTIHFSATYFV
jgi:hypothetical protein